LRTFLLTPELLKSSFLHMSTEQPNNPATPPPPNFLNVLKEMLRASDKVSDLIFSPGRPPQIEIAGKLVPVSIPGLEKLTAAHTAGIAKLIIGNHQVAAESLEKTGSADLSFSAPGEGTTWGRRRHRVWKRSVISNASLSRTAANCVI